MGEASRKRQERREAQQRLVAWLPQAMEDAVTKVGALEHMSPIAKASMSHVTLDHLDAVEIYPAPKGGWHADIVMKDVPHGVANTFGTPVENPCRTREEAEETGRLILASVVALIQLKDPAEASGPPVFLLHDYTFPLAPEVYEIAMAVMPHFANGYGSQLQACARVEEVLAELCPDGFDGEAFNNWPTQKQARLLSVLHIAALSGLLVYPMRQDRAPKGAAK